MYQLGPLGGSEDILSPIEIIELESFFKLHTENYIKKDESE
jgi:hypothetical protein